MINPSASGWIDKFLKKLKPAQEHLYADQAEYYRKVRGTGFVYGHIISFGTKTHIDTTGWLKDEISKVALLNALYGMYRITTGETKHIKFITESLRFYSSMNPQGFNLFRKVFSGGPEVLSLEKIIDDRVQTNHDIVSRNFTHFVTNALLFIDVLAFYQFLKHGEVTEKYLRKIEETIVSLISLALKAKTQKSVHDDLLIKLFEASIRYSKSSKATALLPEHLKLEYFTENIEKFYLIDLTGMALWSDGLIEKGEAYFLHNIGELMQVDDEYIRESMVASHEFISTFKSEIPYFHTVNPVKHFYDHITENVVVLIRRNKNRLLKEISQSSELMVLLANSTHRDLDAKEKKKVKSQLLEICKTIPSLTIFLLPGGSLLLPILIKFIPQMLPTAFNENKQPD
ncbi:MAG TPA: LETM1-related biofilm-associated protein [Flavobacterium sp.]|jgi:hypothetical protein